MSAQSLLHARHYNAYHNNNSLLFQFILSEFISGYKEIQAINIVLKKRKKVEEQTILLTFKKLVGSSQDYIRLFSWNFVDGILFKLKNYCALFAQMDSQNKEYAALFYYANKMWGYGIQALSILKEPTLLLEILEKTQITIQRISRLIERLIESFRDDENVIFFIMRHHIDFDDIYGMKFTVHLLRRLFTQGLKEAQNFISQKYEGRGFYHLVPTINSLVVQLEK